MAIHIFFRLFKIDKSSTAETYFTSNLTVVHYFEKVKGPRKIVLNIEILKFLKRF